MNTEKVSLLSPWMTVMDVMCSNYRLLLLLFAHLLMTVPLIMFNHQPPV